MESGSKDEREAIQVYARDPELEAERKRAAQLHADIPIWMYGASPEQIARFRAAGIERAAHSSKKAAAKASEICDCGTQPVDGVCQWPVKRYVPATVDTLREGDYVCRWNEDGPLLGTCRIHSLAWSKPEHDPPPGFRPILTVTIKLMIRYQSGNQKISEVTLNAGNGIKILRSVPCGAGVCWQCGREPAEGVRVCDAHRDAWEKVA